MYDRILVALDGSELAQRVLPHVEALADKFGSQLTLLRAIPPMGTYIAPTAMGLPMAYPVTDFTEAMEAARETAAEYLNGVAQALKGRGLNVQIEYPEGEAADLLVERAKAVGANLIAMTTHGETGLARFFLGSVAEDVLRHTPCPVLMVRVVEHKKE
jgi:nucleotide-binding universal stress UspA family protein